MKKAFIPGTFDPPTLGHLNIIQRAATLCDNLTIGVTNNTQKAKPILSLEDRIAFLKQITHNLSNITILPFSGLVIEAVQKQKIDVIVKGLRSAADLDYENAMAVSNKQMCGVETLFLMTDPRYAHISSSLVREIASYGHRLKGFVPDEIEQSVLEKFKRT